MGFWVSGFCLAGLFSFVLLPIPCPYKMTLVTNSESALYLYGPLVFRPGQTFALDCALNIKKKESSTKEIYMIRIITNAW